MRYQPDPDFQPGQLVPQAEPLTVAATVTVLASDSDVLIVAPVEALVRRLTPEQAGTNGAPVGVAGAVAAGVGAVVGMGVGVGVGAAVGGAVGVGVGVAVGAGPATGISTPTAAYRMLIPYREATDWPLTWVTVYQPEPDFQVGQDVPHDEPVTDPETVKVLAGVSEVLIDALVDELVRRFTLEQDGAIVCDDAAIGPTAISTSIAAATSAVSHRLGDGRCPTPGRPRCEA